MSEETRFFLSRLWRIWDFSDAEKALFCSPGRGLMTAWPANISVIPGGMPIFIAPLQDRYARAYSWVVFTGWYFSIWLYDKFYLGAPVGMRTGASGVVRRCADICAAGRR
jgi:hypothetical protein